MTPGVCNLTVTAGDGYSVALTFTDDDGEALDVSAYTHSAQVRRIPGAADAEDFTVDEAEAATGVVTISLTAEQTRSLRPGTNFWDLERAVGDGDPQTILGGKFTVLYDVTRIEAEA